MSYPVIRVCRDFILCFTVFLSFSQTANAAISSCNGLINCASAELGTLSFQLFDNGSLTDIDLNISNTSNTKSKARTRLRNISTNTTIENVNKSDPGWDLDLLSEISYNNSGINGVAISKVDVDENNPFASPALTSVSKVISNTSNNDVKLFSRTITSGVFENIDGLSGLFLISTSFDLIADVLDSNLFKAKAWVGLDVVVSGSGSTESKHAVKEVFTTNSESSLSDSGTLFAALDIQPGDIVEFQLTAFSQVKANGNPVPLPPAIWMFVTALVALITIKKN